MVKKRIAAFKKRRPFCPMHYLTPIRNFRQMLPAFQTKPFTILKGAGRKAWKRQTRLKEID
jgi:hypothetical protein